MTVFKFTDVFFFVIKSYLEGHYLDFLINYCILQLQDFCFCLQFLFLVEHHIYFMYCFPNFIQLYIQVLCILWNLLKIAILSYLSVHKSPFLQGKLFELYQLSVMTCSPSPLGPWHPYADVCMFEEVIIFPFPYPFTLVKKDFSQSSQAGVPARPAWIIRREVGEFC